MKLTGIYDNTADQESLIPGWGFSLLLTGSNKKILFDAGADINILKHNLDELEVDPNELDGVVLSHSHCDHVGGLSAVLNNNSDLVVCLTESFPDTLKSSVKSHGAELVSLSEPEEIFDGIWTTGEMYGSHGGQDIPEQGLIFESPAGPVIIAGCAHPGIENMVHRSRDIVGDPPRLVVGGFHLGDKELDELKDIVANLKHESVERIAPTHCTGSKAIDFLRDQFEEDFVEFGAGTEIVI